MRALLVDVDEDQRILVTETLAGYGYEPREMDLAHGLVDLARLVPVDLLLGRLTNVVLLTQIRLILPFTPVIVISKEDAVETIVQAVRAGVIDYIPISQLSRARLGSAIEMARTIYQTLTQNQSVFQAFSRILSPYSKPSAVPDAPDVYKVDERIRLGDLVLDPHHLTALYKGQSLDLSQTEFRILYLLSQRIGKVITFEEIAYMLRGVQIGYHEARKMLSAHLSNLRTKMRAVGCDHYLVNRRGRGYLMDDSVAEFLQQTQPYLQLLAEKSPSVIGYIDSNRIIRYLNPAVLTVLGYDPANMIGDPLEQWLSVVHTEDLPKLFSMVVNGQFSEGKSLFRIRHAKGQYLWLETSTHVVLDSQGLAVGLLFNAYNVTEHKQNDWTLHSLRHFMATLMRALPLIVLRVSRDGTIMEIHTKENGLASLVGQNIYEQMSMPDALKFMSFVENTIQTGDMFQVSMNTPGIDSIAGELRFIAFNDDEALVISDRGGS